MPTTTTLVRRRNPMAFAAGTLDVLIAGTALAGYASGQAALVTLIPGSAPMRISTALAILCCGAAILLLAAGWKKTAAGAGAVCGAIGIAKLIEAAGNFHMPGVDVPGLAGTMPPRAGTLIACLTILAAAALALMSGAVRVRVRLAAVGLIGSLLFCAGGVAALSYAAGVSTAFAVGEYSQLSIPTSVALAALGAALIRFAWRDSLTADAGTPAWLPLLVCIGVLSTTLCLYAAIDADQKSDFDHEVTFQSEALMQFLSAGLENRTQPLIRMARRRAAVPDMKKEDWDTDAQMLLTRGGYQAVEWLDRDGKVIWATPPGAGDHLADGTAIFEPRRRTAIEAARRTRALAASRPVDLVTGGKGAVVLVPVFVGEELAGYIAGVFRYHLLFQTLLSSNPAPQYAIRIYDGEELIFTQGVRNQSAGLVRFRDLTVGGTHWKVEIAPTESLVLQAQSPLGGALLVTGGILAVLFGLMVRVAQRPAPAHVLNLPAAPAPAFSGPSPDAGRLPVVTYRGDGNALAWNDAAKTVFAGTPPPVAAFDGFRMVQAALLRSTASPGNMEALRGVLESCAVPVLLFDAAGNFVSANATAQRTLGWSDTVWNGRGLGSAAPAAGDAFEVGSVLIVQGKWAIAGAQAAAAGA